MPTFATPGPIAVTIDVPAGDVRVVASDRADTVVEVHAGHGGDQATVDATRVELVNGQLLVKGPEQRGWGGKWGLGLLGLGRSGNVEVLVEVPSGSRVHGRTRYGDFRGEGPLGECRLRNDYGDIRIERAGPVDLSVAAGEIVVDRVEGHAEISNGAGEIRIGDVEGSAVLRSDHGDIRVGEVTGELRMTGANADMHVERALAGVDARNAYGGVRLGEVVRGAVALTSTYGRLEVGVRTGTAAWLDVSSTSGRLHNSLDERDDPAGFAETVEIRARTGYGDVVVRRA